MQTAQKNRRQLKGLLDNKRTQFRAAVICTSLILFPALLTGVLLISNLAIQVNTMIETGTAGPAVAQATLNQAFTYGLILIAIFAVCSAVSIFIALKLSNHIVGPVQKIENYVDALADGRYEERLVLRKGDYLIELAERLNRLADLLKQKNPPTQT